MQRRDDAGGHGAAQRERVADRHDPIADARPGRVAELHERQTGRLDLEQRQVGGGIAADQPRRVLATVGQGDADRLHRGASRTGGDDVVVGDDVTIGRDDEARAERLCLSRDRPAVGAGLRRAAVVILTEQLPERSAGERIALLRHRHALRGRDVDHRRLQPRDHVGEAHRRTGAGRGGGDHAGRVLRRLSIGGLHHHGRGSAAQQQGLR